MGLGGVAIATLPSVIFPKLMFSDRLGGGKTWIYAVKLVYTHYVNVFSVYRPTVFSGSRACSATLFAVSR